MREQIITVSSYGLCCLSVSCFTDFLQLRHQARTKKLAAFFDKNKSVLEEAMQTGNLLPIAGLNALDYVIQVREGRHAFADDWVEVLTLTGCNLQVGPEAAVWVSSTGALNEWDPTLYRGKETISYKTLDNELLYKAHKFSVKPGKYKVTLRGFKRLPARGYPAADFGFAFELSAPHDFDTFTNPLLSNLNIAKM
jgi:hypothetical protein